MNVDQQLKIVEDFFKFSLSLIPDYSIGITLNSNAKVNYDEIKKQILEEHNTIINKLDSDMAKEFKKRSSYLKHALEMLPSNDDNLSIYSNDDQSISSDSEDVDDIDSESDLKNKDLNDIKISSKSFENNKSNKIFKSTDIFSDSEIQNKKFKINIKKAKTYEQTEDGVNIDTSKELSKHSKMNKRVIKKDEKNEINKITNIDKNKINDILIINDINEKQKNILKRVNLTEIKQSVKKQKKNNQNVTDFDEAFKFEDDFENNQLGENRLTITNESDTEITNSPCRKNRDELKQRLKEKIEICKAKRLARMDEDDKSERKREKRRASKHKMRQKKQLEKQKLNNTNETEEKKIIVDTKKLCSDHPVFNRNREILYSKLEIPGTENKKILKKKLKGITFGRNYSCLLEKIHKQDEKLNNLKTKDPKLAETVEQKLLWKKLIAKAEGVKVKDDPEKLQKSLNKKNFRKEMRANRWHDREEKVKKKINDKQNKRKDNIRRKCEQKKKSKMKKRRNK